MRITSTRLKGVETSKMLTAMKVINVMNMVVVMILGGISFARLGMVTSQTSPVQRFFVAGYTVCFSVLLCVFELRLARFDPDLRRKCGFLFSFMGKTLFIFL